MVLFWGVPDVPKILVVGQSNGSFLGAKKKKKLSGIALITTI
jgi:hypothetical protein